MGGSDMTQVDLGEVFPDNAEWAERLAAAPPAPLDWPAPAAVAAELDRLGLSAEDRDEALAAYPAVREGVPSWLLSRLLGYLHEITGDERQPWLGLPFMPDALGAAGRCLPVYLFVLGLPAVRAYHRRRGVPAAVTEATLADLGRHVAIHRRMFGTTGVDSPGWMTVHLRGLLYECGSLQYEPARFRARQPAQAGAGQSGAGQAGTGQAGTGQSGTGPADDEPVLSVHIPEGAPLSTDSVLASLGEARDLFAAHFPDPPRRFAVCHSWLLDDQLAEYLPETSNIVRFQRLFRLVPGGADGDRDVLTFVFRKPDAGQDELGGLPQRTTLDRAVVAHLRSGRHWRVRSGWLPLG